MEAGHTCRSWLGRCAAIAAALAMSVGATAQVGPPPEGPMDGSEDYYNIAADARRIAAALAELDIAPPEGELLDVTAELDAVDIKPRDTVPNYDVDVLGPNRIYASRLSKGCGIAIVGMIEFSGLKEKRQGGVFVDRLERRWRDAPCLRRRGRGGAYQTDTGQQAEQLLVSALFARGQIMRSVIPEHHASCANVPRMAWATGQGGGGCGGC